MLNPRIWESKCVFAGHTASYNTAFTKLAKMNVVGTLRECPERYLQCHRIAARPCADQGD